MEGESRKWPFAGQTINQTANSPRVPRFLWEGETPVEPDLGRISGFGWSLSLPLSEQTHLKLLHTGILPSVHLIHGLLSPLEHHLNL